MEQAVERGTLQLQQQEQSGIAYARKAACRFAISKAGDRLLLYTEGASEAANQEAEEFGYQRIAAATASAQASAADCQRRVMEDVMRFCGGEFGDDVTLIAAAVH